MSSLSDYYHRQAQEMSGAGDDVREFTAARKVVQNRMNQDAFIDVNELDQCLTEDHTFRKALKVMIEFIEDHL
jgi:hypothetical protein